MLLAVSILATSILQCSNNHAGQFRAHHFSRIEEFTITRFLLINYAKFFAQCTVHVTRRYAMTAACNLSPRSGSGVWSCMLLHHQPIRAVARVLEALFQSVRGGPFLPLPSLSPPLPLPPHTFPPRVRRAPPRPR